MVVKPVPAGTSPANWRFRQKRPGGRPYFFLSLPALISARSQTTKAGPKQIARPSGTTHNPHGAKFVSVIKPYRRPSTAQSKAGFFATAGFPDFLRADFICDLIRVRKTNGGKLPFRGFEMSAPALPLLNAGALILMATSGMSRINLGGFHSSRLTLPFPKPRRKTIKTSGDHAVIQGVPSRESPNEPGPHWRGWKRSEWQSAAGKAPRR